MSGGRRLIPYRLLCCFAVEGGHCNYWNGEVKCIGCKFVNHPEKAKKERDQLAIWHQKAGRRQRKKRFDAHTLDEEGAASLS